MFIDVKSMTNLNDNDDMEELNKDALIGIIDRISGDIQIGNIVAYMYDKSDDEYGYDLVKWDSLPYTLQDDDPNNFLKRGDRVVNVTNLYRLNKRKNWYYSSLTESIIKVLHVVVAHVDMQTDIIPRGYSYNDIKDTYMGKMSDVCHEFILDEIKRRDRLNYEEERMVFSDEREHHTFFLSLIHI